VHKSHHKHNTICATSGDTYGGYYGGDISTVESGLIGGDTHQGHCSGGGHHSDTGGGHCSGGDYSGGGGDSGGGGGGDCGGGDGGGGDSGGGDD
jgi:hypothetical protein